VKVTSGKDGHVTGRGNHVRSRRIEVDAFHASGSLIAAVSRLSQSVPLGVRRVAAAH
jgi:hypothetical protein